MNSTRILLTLSLLMCSLEAHGAQQDPIQYDPTGGYASAADAIKDIQEGRDDNGRKFFACPICSHTSSHHVQMQEHLHSEKHLTTVMTCNLCGRNDLSYRQWRKRHRFGKCKPLGTK